jgi:predicted permease
MKIWKRMRLWLKRREFERDLAEEVQFHREMAGPAFGSEALALEDSRAVWGLAWLDSWALDIRYALRGFRRSPGFAIGVVGTIGLALGLNTTMFTVFDAYALRPYAVHDPYGLYDFGWYQKDDHGHWFSWRQYQQVRGLRTPFSDVHASLKFGAEVDGRTLLGQAVSGNYFDMLGAGMTLGRPLLPDDAGSVMVLGYEAWRNKFASDPGMIGRKVYLRGKPFEVVGIAGGAFTGLESLPVGFWIPLRAASQVMNGPDVLGEKATEPLSLVGRLRPGVSVEAARSELLAWVQGFAPEAVGVRMESKATSVPLTKDSIVTFIPIFTAFGLVLLIACANVSNMMLARALSRQREVAIRVSLGAGRARLIRQLLTESVLLAVPGAIAGLLISFATLEAARRIMFATVPAAFGRILELADLTPDWRVFGFLLLAAVATALLFGLAPAIQTTRSRLVEANRGDFSSDYRPARLRSILVVTQVAVCLFLLISTAVVLRTEGRAMDRRTGLVTQGIWDIKALSKYQARIVERLAAEPGTEGVAVAWRAPLYGSLRQIGVTPSGSKDAVQSGYNFVSEGYFPIFRIPVVRGRLFTKAESDTDAPVVVVSEAAARKLWPDRDAIGETIAIPAVARTYEYGDRGPAYNQARVIGVVKNVRTSFFGREPEESCLYFPTNARAEANDSVLVRLGGEQGPARRRLVKALEQVAPSVWDFLIPMDDVAALQVYPFRVVFWVAGFLGGVALLMTVSGIYAVMSYLVSQRTKEIGIRVALGATAWDVVRTVVRQSARLAVIGTVLGVGMALLVAPIFAHEIDLIQPYDGLAYGWSVAMVLAAAMAAAFSPARRAVALDPVTTLRCD